MRFQFYIIITIKNDIFKFIIIFKIDRNCLESFCFYKSFVFNSLTSFYSTSIYYTCKEAL